MGGPCQQGPWALHLAVSRLWITGALRSGGPRSSEDASRHVGHGHTEGASGVTPAVTTPQARARR
jgi:hypothetical protein